MFYTILWSDNTLPTNTYTFDRGHHSCIQTFKYISTLLFWFNSPRGATKLLLIPLVRVKLCVFNHVPTQSSIFFPGVPWVRYLLPFHKLVYNISTSLASPPSPSFIPVPSSPLLPLPFPLPCLKVPFLYSCPFQPFPFPFPFHPSSLVADRILPRRLHPSIELSKLAE